MKKIRLLFFLLIPFLLNAQTTPYLGLQSNAFTATGPFTSLNLTGSSIAWHQITWTTSGTVSTCQIKLQQSADNVNWSDLIANTTCTSNGQSSATNVVATYVRMNMTTLTGGGSVTVVWTGYINNPTGGGGTGCTVSGSTTGLLFNSGSSTCNTSSDFTISSHTLAGGASAVFDLHLGNSFLLPGSLSTGALKVTTGTGALGQAACADLSNGGTGCTATISNYAPLASPTFTTKVTLPSGATDTASGNIFNIPTGVTLNIASGGTLTCAGGSTCPAGGSGTVNTGTATHLAYYATSTTAVSDAGADLVFDGTHTYSASSSLIFNLHSAPSFFYPVSAGCTSATTGSICYDTTAKNTHLWTNGADSLAVAEAAAITANTITKSNSSTIGLVAASLATDNATTFSYSGTGGITASAGPLTSGNPAGGVGSSHFFTQEGTVPSGLSTSGQD